MIETEASEVSVIDEKSINESKQILHDFNSNSSLPYIEFVDFINKRMEESDWFQYTGTTFCR